jgi:hypothetical protein
MRFKQMAVFASVLACGISMPAMAYDTPPELMMVVPPAPKGKGLVVFYRSASIFGAAISCAVSENDKKISSMGSGAISSMPLNRASTVFRCPAKPRIR